MRVGRGSELERRLEESREGTSMDYTAAVYNAARDGNLFRLKVYLTKASPTCNEEELSMCLGGKVGGATPLVIACRNGHYDVAEYLIERCKADIELPGSVTFDGETIEGAPPLWCAAAAGHLPLVRLLVRAGARVNSTTRTHSTPLRAACFDGHLEIVKYLVGHGADIEIANRHGHTCLMIACYKGHIRIAKFLLSLGADVNRKSVKGNTALHDCAESGSLLILKMLLEHGARMDVDSYGMTPLLAASVTGHNHIVEHLISLDAGFVSRRQRIDALELLGATYVDKRRDMVGALVLWKRAMDDRFPAEGTPLPKPRGAPPLEAYDGATEAEGARELDELLADPDAMRMQALVIRERILGPAHPDTSYYVRYRGAVYADAGRFRRCRQLWHHALDMQRAMLPPLSPMTHSSLYSFAELFSYMLSERARPPSRGRIVPPVTFEDINPVFTKALLEIRRGLEMLESRASVDREQTLATLQRVLVISLHLAALMARLPDEPDCGEGVARDVHDAIFRLLQLQVKVKKGRTALHVAVSEEGARGRGSAAAGGAGGGGALPGQGDVQPCCRALVALMLRLGAPPDARDADGNTPLHLLAKLNPCPTEVARELLAHGAHIDTVNYAGETAADILRASGQTIWSIVNPLHHTTLKCLAAKTVKNYRLPYRNNVPRCLYDTIITH